MGERVTLHRTLGRVGGLVFGTLLLLLLVGCGEPDPGPIAPTDVAVSPTASSGAAPSPTPLPATDPTATSPSPSGTRVAESTTQAYPLPVGSRPHDAAPALDGGVWYTAQGSGELGWLDPATGKTRHTPLGAGSRPHGVIVGPDGAPWITDGGLNAIVRVDSETLDVDIFHCLQIGQTQTSIRLRSIATATCGSRARMVSTAGWIRAPGTWRYSTLPGVAGLMGLP